MLTNLREITERVWEWFSRRPQTDLEKYLILKGAKSPADVEHWIREYTYKNGNSLT